MHAPIPSIELLETRIAPAGVITVTVSGGVLTLSGDVNANSVTVNALDAGTVDLVPAAGTHLLFHGADSAGTVNVPVAQPVLVAKLGGGADALTLNGTFAGLSIDLGAAANALTF